jgi:hypothetical protein
MPVKEAPQRGHGNDEAFLCQKCRTDLFQRSVVVLFHKCLEPVVIGFDPSGSPVAAKRFWSNTAYLTPLLALDALKTCTNRPII